MPVAGASSKAGKTRSTDHSWSPSRPSPRPGAQPTAQPPQQARAQLTPAVASQSNPPAGSPVDTIRQHYTFIDAKRYADGYALMDAHLRSLNSSADYQGWFVDK